MNAKTQWPVRNLVGMIIILFCGVWSAGLHAQEQRIVLPAGEMSVERIVQEIEAQSNLIVGVNHRNFDVARKVRLDTGPHTAKQLLDRVVGGTDHTYITRGKHVIIVRKEKPVVARRHTQTQTSAEPAPFVMQEGVITLPEEEMPEVGDTIVHEYKTIAFSDDRRATFYVSESTPGHTVDISDIRIEEKEGNVFVDFRITAGAEAVGSKQALTVLPVLHTDSVRHELRAFALEGRRHRLSLQRRARSLGQTVAEDPNRLKLRNGDTLTYRESIPASLFTPGATLVFETDAANCRLQEETRQTGADRFVTVHREVILPEIPPVLTTGDRIARDYAFVEPDPGPELRILKPDRQKALTVYYELDKFDLRFDYRDNNNTLSQMLAAINIIKESGDSEITYVVLTGYASPEGTAARNEILAGNRSKVLRDFISKHTALPAQTFIMHNGGSDWEGLELMLRDLDEEWKESVLEIIRNAPEADRMRRIARLDNGRVYQYLRERIFPDLRNAAYIKVYYKNKDK